MMQQQLNWRALAVLLLLSLMSTFAETKACQRPPTIDGVDRDNSYEFTISGDNSALTLRCYGADPVQWVVRPGLEEYTEVTEGYTAGRYSASMKLVEPYIEDTGNFTCSSKATNCSADVYVFISNGEYNFVNPDELLTVQGTTDDVIVIDCRTTSPDIEVTLYKDDQKIFYPFEVKRGFVIENPAVIMSGLHQCQISVGNVTKTLNVMLKVTSGTQQNLPVPVIKPLPNTHFVVGHPFRLECTVPSTRAVTFTWTHYDEHPTGSQPERVDNRAKTKKSIYSVDSATLAHSGVYQCRVSRPPLRSTSSNITVNILESKRPVLNMTSEPFVIFVNKSQEVFWKVMVEFYPQIPEVAYYDPRNDRVKQSQRINSTFNSVTGEARLQINDVQPSDFGNWTLQAHTDHMEANTSVRIIVASNPEAHLTVPSSMKPGPVAGVSCEVTAFYKNSTGFVTPDVRFSAASCTHSTSACLWKELNLETNVTRLENRVVFEPLLEGSPLASLASSTLLQCTTSYSHTQPHSDEKLLVVTDLSDRWEFIHVDDNGEQHALQNKFQNKTVVVNDKFELSCGATSVLYNTPSLTFSKETVSAVGTLEQTNYSTTVRYEVTQASEDQEGSYSCTAAEKQGGLNNRTLLVTVIPEQPITLPPPSTLELGQTLEAYVEAGKPVDIVCSPQAAPTPLVHWEKDGSLLEDSTIVRNRTTLHFDFFSTENEGLYTCVMTRRGVEHRASVHYYVEDRRAKISLIILYVAGGIICLLMVAFVYLVLRVMRERTKSRERNAAKLEIFKKGNVDEINPELRLDEQAELLPYDTKYEVSRDRISMGRQLGSGAFGRVVKAEVKGLDEDDPEKVLPVAIKMTKSLSDPSHLKNLGSELKIMIHLGKHLNIVNLLGANTERIGKGELWILVEYCRYGDLLTFVHKYRKRFISQIDPINDSIIYSIPPWTPNSASLPFSPTVNNHYRTRDRPSVSTDPEGYLMPNSASPPIVLADPPKGHSARSSRATSPQEASSPQDPRSPQGALSPTESVAFFADNPGYGKLGAASHGSPGSVPQSPSSPSNVQANSPTATSQILLSPISEAPADNSMEATLAVSHSPSSMQAYSAVNGPPSASALPYMNVGVAQPSPRSPPPYVSQGFVPPSSPEKSCSTEAGTPSHRGSVGGPYKIVNTDMTTVSSPRPFSPTYTDWRDSESYRSGTTIGKGIPGRESPFTTTDLLCWAWQVAQGMDYLTTRRVLHGDLAARNLLLAEGNVIKISDFGLSRDIYKQNYLKQSDDLMPIKWMSIEAIRDRCFSVESDVWAYGITLWELFNLGKAPYPGVEVNPQFLKSLEDGMRCDKPQFCNQKIYQIMYDCWHEDPQMRPSFASIMARLRPMVPPEILENFDTMNENYLQMNEDYFKQRTDYLSMFLSPEFNNIQKPEQEPPPGYVNFQNMSEEERVRQAIEYQKMVSQCGSFGEGGGYLSMAVMGEHPPPDSNTIFSPNPVASANDTKRFTFHSTEDMVPPTTVPSSPYSSNASTTYRLLPQSPPTPPEISETNDPVTDDDAEERNSFLRSNEADESEPEATSIVNAHYHNYQV